MATPMLMYGRKHQHGLNWITAIAMIGFHIGAVAALFYIDYGAMLAALILYYAAGMLGIGMAYHRLLTHRSYKTPKCIEYFLTMCGTLALEGGPIFWVATHRIHHQKSDQEGDPHTPREGTWWAHMGWILMGEGLHHDASVLREIRARPRARPVPRLALQLALDHQRRRRPGAPRVRRHPVCAVGHLLPHDLRPARHVAGEFGDAPVGLAPLQDARRLDQQLVGRAPHLRRRLAQQPPRAPDQRPSRPGLVRARLRTGSASARCSCSAWPGTSRSRRSGSRSPKKRSCRRTRLSPSHSRPETQKLQRGGGAYACHPVLRAHRSPSMTPSSEGDRVLRRAVRAARRGRHLAEHRLDHCQCRPHHPDHPRHRPVRPDHRRADRLHGLPRARDQAQRGARHLHQRRHPRTEDAHRLDPAVSGDAAIARGARRAAARVLRHHARRRRPAPSHRRPGAQGRCRPREAQGGGTRTSGHGGARGRVRRARRRPPPLAG